MEKSSAEQTVQVSPPASVNQDNGYSNALVGLAVASVVIVIFVVIGIGLKRFAKKLDTPATSSDPTWL